MVEEIYAAAPGIQVKRNPYLGPIFDNITKLTAGSAKEIAIGVRDGIRTMGHFYDLAEMKKKAVEAGFVWDARTLTPMDEQIMRQAALASEEMSNTNTVSNLAALAIGAGTMALDKNDPDIQEIQDELAAVHKDLPLAANALGFVAMGLLAFPILGGIGASIAAKAAWGPKSSYLLKLGTVAAGLSYGPVSSVNNAIQKLPIEMQDDTSIAELWAKETAKTMAFLGFLHAGSGAIRWMGGALYDKMAPAIFDLVGSSLPKTANFVINRVAAATSAFLMASSGQVAEVMEGKQEDIDWDQTAKETLAYLLAMETMHALTFKFGKIKSIEARKKYDKIIGEQNEVISKALGISGKPPRVKDMIKEGNVKVDMTRTKKYFEAMGIDPKAVTKEVMDFVTKGERKAVKSVLKIPQVEKPAEVPTVAKVPGSFIKKLPTDRGGIATEGLKKAFRYVEEKLPEPVKDVKMMGVRAVLELVDGFLKNPAMRSKDMRVKINTFLDDVRQGNLKAGSMLPNIFETMLYQGRRRKAADKQIRTRLDTALKQHGAETKEVQDTVASALIAFNFRRPGSQDKLYGIGLNIPGIKGEKNIALGLGNAAEFTKKVGKGRSVAETVTADIIKLPKLIKNGEVGEFRKSLASIKEVLRAHSTQYRVTPEEASRRLEAVQALGPGPTKLFETLAGIGTDINERAFEGFVAPTVAAERKIGIQGLVTGIELLKKGRVLRSEATKAKTAETADKKIAKAEYYEFLGSRSVNFGGQPTQGYLTAVPEGQKKAILNEGGLKDKLIRQYQKAPKVLLPGEKLSDRKTRTKGQETPPPLTEALVKMAKSHRLEGDFKKIEKLLARNSIPDAVMQQIATYSGAPLEKEQAEMNLGGLGWRRVTVGKQKMWFLDDIIHVLPIEGDAFVFEGKKEDAFNGFWKVANQLNKNLMADALFSYKGYERDFFYNLFQRAPTALFHETVERAWGPGRLKNVILTPVDFVRASIGSLKTLASKIPGSPVTKSQYLKQWQKMFNYLGGVTDRQFTQGLKKATPKELQKAPYLRTVEKASKIYDKFNETVFKTRQEVTDDIFKRTFIGMRLAAKTRDAFKIWKDGGNKGSFKNFEEMYNENFLQHWLGTNYTEKLQTGGKYHTKFETWVKEAADIQQQIHRNFPDYSPENYTRVVNFIKEKVGPNIANFLIYQQMSNVRMGEAAKMIFGKGNSAKERVVGLGTMFSVAMAGIYVYNSLGVTGDSRRWDVTAADKVLARMMKGFEEGDMAMQTANGIFDTAKHMRGIFAIAYDIVMESRGRGKKIKETFQRTLLPGTRAIFGEER